MVERYNGMVEIYMRETSIMDNLKMQAHARVYKENKLELEEKRHLYWYDFVIKGASLKDHIGSMGDVSRWILKDDSP